MGFNMGEEFNTTLSLMLTLLKATGKYVYPRISNIKHQQAYQLGMQFSLSILNSELAEPVGLMSLKKEIASLRNSVPSHFPDNFFNRRTDEREYYNLAIDHALDIIFSLEAKFITGEGDREPRNYRGKFIHLYNEENIFD